MKTNWLEKIEFELPEIVKVVNKCDEHYRLKCFELLLSHALNSMEKVDQKKVTEKENINPTPNTTPKKQIVELDEIGKSPKYQKFLRDNELLQKQIDNLIDLESGEIIGMNIGTKGSDITRNIAVLLALWHFSQDGNFSFTSDELKLKTKAYGVEFHNQKRDIKKVSFESKKVFIEQDDTWIIPIPAQPYVVQVIKRLNNHEE
jgi:hypothetical protein